MYNNFQFIFRNKTEESLLPNALLSIVIWLVQIFEFILSAFMVDKKLKPIQIETLQKITKVIEKIETNQFILCSVYIAKFEDPELYSRLTIKYCDISNALLKSDLPEDLALSDGMRKIVFVDVGDLKMREYDSSKVEAINHCLQPLIAIEVLLRPSADVKHYANKMKMVQRLKNYSNARLYMEIMKACLTIMYNVYDTTRESLFGAFTFIKIPQILKLLDQMSRDEESLEYSPDIVAAFELLIKETVILNFNDTQLHENTVECLLKEMLKQGLVTEKHMQVFAAKCEAMSTMCQKLEPIPPNKQNKGSIIQMVQRADSPLNGILKTFNSDYAKVQEALHSMLFQMLKGNSQELILSVAIIEGKLKTFVSLLIKCNEFSRQNLTDTDKAAHLRSELFDVTFLLLVYTIQSYGSEAVLDGNGETFFEKWVRDCMVERNKPKSPMAIVRQCDSAKVDELLMHLRNPENKCTLKWEEVCRNIPGVLYHTLQAWENDTITSSEAKTILDGLTKKLSAFSVCAGSWLCAYMQTIRQEELQKAMSMVQLISQTQSEEENVRRRLGLTQQIVRKMQSDFHPAGSPKMRALMHTQNLVSRNPLQEQYDEIWKSINEIGFLSIESAQLMESLLQACGHKWLVQRLVAQICSCKFIHEMNRTADIAFALIHLDIEQCTITMLTQVVANMLLNKLSTELVQPYSIVVARLCVYAILACAENGPAGPAKTTSGGRKRQRSVDSVEDSGPSAKLIKLGTSSEGVDSGNEFASVRIATLSEPLTRCLKNLFQIFQYYLNTDSLNPKVYFIFQFVSLLIQCGKAKSKPIVKTFPLQLIQSILKIIPVEDLNVGLVAQSYDLDSTLGRHTCVSDLCLLRNIQLKSGGIKF